MIGAQSAPTTATATRAAAVVGRWVRRFDRLLTLIGGTAAVLVLVVVGITLFTSVVLRYVSGSSLGFATELPSYLFPWLICGGIVAAAATNGHLAVDFFVDRLPGRARRVVAISMWVLVVLAFWVLLTASFRIMGAYTSQSTPILGWPSVGSYFAFPITLAILMVHSAGRAVATAVGADTGAHTVPEAAGSEVQA
jgi:TRAP-type C4-dicarboxylate transport system permease small subunit